MDIAIIGAILRGRRHCGDVALTVSDVATGKRIIRNHRPGSERDWCDLPEVEA